MTNEENTQQEQTQPEEPKKHYVTALRDDLEAEQESSRAAHAELEALRAEMDALKQEVSDDPEMASLGVRLGEIPVLADAQNSAMQETAALVTESPDPLPHGDSVSLEQELVSANLERDKLKAAMEIGRERLDPRADAEIVREGGRIPLGGMSLRLELKGYDKQIEGYHPRWINDDGDRVMRALEGGYEPIIQNRYLKAENTDMGSWVSQSVGTKKDGSPLRAFAMKLRNDLWEQDQEEKRRRIQQIEDAIKTGHGPGSPNDPRDASQTYVKTVSIER